MSEVRGGGEWTALREALELMVKELDWYAGKHGLGPARLQYALVRGREALAAAAPAPPQFGGTVGLDGDTQRDWATDGPALEKRVKELEAAPPPQDGQGAELLGPPRGGSSSDLADSSNPGAVKADEILMRIAQRYENCKVNIYPDMPYLTPVEAVLRCAQEEGFRLISNVPEAVAGNASAPVGEKRQPSGVGEPQIYETADAIWKRMYKFSTGQDFPAGEMVSPAGQGIIAQEIRKLLAQSAAREVGEGLREALLAFNDSPLRLDERTDCMAVAIYGRPHPTDGGNYAALYRGGNKEFARLVVAAVNYCAALAAPAPKPVEDYGGREYLQATGLAPKPAPPAQPSCKCSTLDGQGICNACADMLRQQVQRQREINAELVKPAPPGEPLQLTGEMIRKAVYVCSGFDGLSAETWDRIAVKLSEARG